MKKIRVAMLVFCFLCLCVSVFAMGPDGNDGGPWSRGGPPPHPMMGPHGMMGPAGLPAELKLDKEQAEKIERLEDVFHCELRPAMRALARAKREVEESFADPKVSDEAIMAKVKAADAMREKVDGLHVRFRLAQRKILTGEQIKLLGEFQCGPGGETPFRDGPKEPKVKKKSR